MIYNFYLGHLASTLNKILGSSISDFQPRTYSLVEATTEFDIASYIKREKDGEMHRIGFYLQFYRIKFWGKSPSLHIEFCENAEKLKNIMRATNSQFVTFYSKEDGMKYSNQKLKVCKKCLSIIKNRTSLNLTGETFDEFILSIEENESLKCKIANSDGYALNWRQISKAYRESMNYTCENCSFKLADKSFSRFLQTHHIDSFNKLNNRRSNLKCLCVKCHSEVDEYHKRQFSSIENQILLSEFEFFRRAGLQTSK